MASGTANNELATLVGSIYDAATGALTWTELGDRLCRQLDAARVYLGIVQPDGTLPNLLRAPDAFDTAYAEYYHKIDPFRIRAANAARDGPTAPHAMLGEDMAPRSEFLKGEYYADYARRRGTRHSMGGQLDTAGQTLIGVFRDSVGARFTEHDLRVLEFLLPHLRRGLQLRRTVAASAPAMDGSLAALDALPLCAVIVDASMRVVFANAAAVRMASDARSGLRIIRSGVHTANAGCILAAGHAGDAAGLKALVAATAANGPGGALRLRAPDTPGSRTPLVAVLVSPVPARMAVADVASAAEGPVRGLALVIARDLAVADAPSSGLLRDLFGLSSGEAAVAMALLGGATAENVALGRNVSIDTIRRQIQMVLRKTEAANLRDFERIAASLSLMQSAPMASPR